MVAAGGNELLVTAMQSAWQAHGPKVIKALKANPFGAPKCLESLKWQVHVPLAGSSLSTGPDPSSELGGIMEFTIVTPTGGGAVKAADRESFAVEFSKEELFQFFGDLEKIQSQLDNLV